MRTVLPLLMAGLAACSTTYHHVGGAYTATKPILLLDLPTAASTDMEAQERATGIIEAGEAYECRERYQSSWDRRRGSRWAWVLLVCRPRPACRGWAFDPDIRPDG